MLSPVKLIAEPWDLGAGGYQVGNFPVLWTEWNGRYRDAVRALLEGRRGLSATSGSRLARLERPLRRRRPAAAREHQLRHRPRRLHAARSRELRREAQRGERRGQPRRRRRQPVVELRRRRARPTTRQSSRCAARSSGTSWRRYAYRRACRCSRRATSWAHPEGQQQRLLPGQRAHLARLDHERRSRALLDFTRKLIAFRESQPVLQRRKFFRGDRAISRLRRRRISRS